MSIQRWAEGFRGGGVRANDGEWVRYDDHVAALAEARADERQQARERVEALPVLDYTDGPEQAFVVRLDRAAAAAGGDA